MLYNFAELDENMLYNLILEIINDDKFHLYLKKCRDKKMNKAMHSLYQLKNLIDNYISDK